MRGLEIIEQDGIFQVVFKSTDKKEVNTISSAIQRFILKNSNTEEITEKEYELNKRIEEIKRGRDITILSDKELEEIALIESELVSKYNETAKHILQGRKFNRSIELEYKITQGRKLEELTILELKKLKEIRVLEEHKKEIEEELERRENKEFVLDDSKIETFNSEEDNNVNEVNEEDPFSANNHSWDRVDNMLFK